MLDRYESSLEERLKKAEVAEVEIQRLQTMAGEAPKLRQEKMRRDQTAERHRIREEAMETARIEVKTAVEKQTQVPALLAQAVIVSNELHDLLKDVDSHRKEAAKALTTADRVDYQIELQEVQDQEAALDRDTKGLDWAVASRHGEARVKKLLDELGPGFHYLRGCLMEGPLTQEIVNLILDRAIPQNGAGPRPDKQS